MSREYSTLHSFDPLNPYGVDVRIRNLSIAKKINVLAMQTDQSVNLIGTFAEPNRNAGFEAHDVSESVYEPTIEQVDDILLQLPISNFSSLYNRISVNAIWIICKIPNVALLTRNAVCNDWRIRQRIRRLLE
jgi:hypothetical protein